MALRRMGIVAAVVAVVLGIAPGAASDMASEHGVAGHGCWGPVGLQSCLSIVGGSAPGAGAARFVPAPDPFGPSSEPVEIVLTCVEVDWGTSFDPEHFVWASGTGTDGKPYAIGILDEAPDPETGATRADYVEVIQGSLDGEPSCGAPTPMVSNPIEFPGEIEVVGVPDPETA